MRCHDMLCDMLDKMICPGSREASKETKWVVRGMVPTVRPTFGSEKVGENLYWGAEKQNLY